MELETYIIKGPPVAKVSKTAAEKKLADHPQVIAAKGQYALREVEGIWVAAVAVPKDEDDEEKKDKDEKEAGTRQSAPPPFAPAEEAPDGPPTDGPPSDEGESEGPPEDGGDTGEEGKPGEEKGGPEAALNHMVEALTHKLDKLMTALGLDDPAEGPLGHEGEPPGPEGAKPPGMDHDPSTPGDQGADGKTHTVHERALKPGEAPPGTTPIGSPAFASTHPDHPWVNVIGQKRTFTIEQPIGDATMASVRAELVELEKDTGYSVKRAKEGVKDGKRIARVLVQANA